ncbi:MAG: helix-hairpin-helix domain-containing protein [Oscillatoriales cyanobacterium C42_A2020_001]|nr:helix-hairpin-helix domain-containing protein [Leptolyngbyaceae cyanobacterium C42_A2020_001]
MRSLLAIFPRLISSFLALLLFFLLLFSIPIPPASAAIAQPDKIPLTLDLLQDKLRNPIQSDGLPTIDLHGLLIDLRPENQAFRDQFYPLLQAQLQKPGTPVGLDLSYSEIQGDFQISLLGLRAPLYGQALSPIFSPTEQEQLQRDRRRLSQLGKLSKSLLATPNDSASTSLQITAFRGPLKLMQTRFTGDADFTNTFFLNRIEAQSVQFAQTSDWSQTRFSQATSFAGAIFGRDARFRSSIFFSKVGFDQAQFEEVTFQSSEFQSTANFNRAVFRQNANFSRIQWQGNADFAQTRWLAQAMFSRSTFSESFFLADAVFEKTALFREVRFNKPVNLRGAAILERAEFGYASFAKGAYLNVPGLRFDSDRAKIVGNPGHIGKYISVPTLQGNENLLRELIRNFRRLEQIPDANQLDYTREGLRLREMRQQVFGTNINAASVAQLSRLGFSAEQAAQIVQRRHQVPFRNPTELLSLGAVDLATFINVRDRIIAKDPTSSGREVWNRISTGLSYIGLGLLLLLSRYGTNNWLIFGVGLVVGAYFGVLFWLVDRWRRITPTPILPTPTETIWVMSGYSVLTLAGFSAVFRNSDYPLMTLASIAAIVIPVPLVLLILLYRQGRYHPKLAESYFTEEGSLRQIRILIGRLPVIPSHEMFRERYMPILWDRRWGWLNYFDFSFNNLLKFGFNDIRLRDQYLPGLITTLVWYQWTLGFLYIALFLWTLSRTIPGLNLLIYFK